MCHCSAWPCWVTGRQVEEWWICGVVPGVRANSREGQVELEKGQGTEKPF